MFTFVNKFGTLIGVLCFLFGSFAFYQFIEVSKYLQNNVFIIEREKWEKLQLASFIRFLLFLIILILILIYKD